MTYTRKNQRSWNHGRMLRARSRLSIGEIIWAKDSERNMSNYEEGSMLRWRRYQRAYVDFFEDQLVLNGYDWKKVLNEYLFTGKEPLINCLIAGCINLSTLHAGSDAHIIYSGAPTHSSWLCLRSFISRHRNGSSWFSHHVLQFPPQIS